MWVAESLSCITETQIEAQRNVEQVSGSGDIERKSVQNQASYIQRKSKYRVDRDTVIESSELIQEQQVERFFRANL